MKLFVLLPAVLLLTTSVVYSDPHKETKKAPHLYISHYENVLGTSMELKVSAGSQTDFDLAQQAVLQEISRMSRILSAYDANSEFRRWEATYRQAVPVSHELFEVLDLFDQWRIRTGGALDASAEVITKVWKKAADKQDLPASEELAGAVALVKQSHWSLDAASRTATHLSNVPLMLNTFVKSYIIQHAADAGMAAAYVNSITVNIGGDMVVAGNVRETVLVSDPKADAENDVPIDRILVNNKAIATSGNYRRGEYIKGQWYSHIVDPRTGQPADSIISATVVAPSATDAGALATAFNVMSVSESIKLAGMLPGIQYLIITRAGQQIKSPGWEEMEIKDGSMPADNNFELLVNLEINLPKQGVVKRPYIAVWVEDEHHAPVRTISLWHGSDRYLSELRSWFLKYKAAYTTDKDFNSSLTSATRSAGKYTVKWDGKDGHGNNVKPGKYIVKIEAAREHGTYQLMRQEIELNDTPQTISLPGNIEIASATLEYRKKANGN